MSTLPWILAAALGLLLIVQAAVTRRLNLRRLEALEARHAKSQRELNGKIESNKRHVAHLMTELAEARNALQAVVTAHSSATAPPDPAQVRRTLERELAAGETVSRSRSSDGFADTEVSMHDTDDTDLLLR